MSNEFTFELSTDSYKTIVLNDKPNSYFTLDMPTIRNTTIEFKGTFDSTSWISFFPEIRRAYTKVPNGIYRPKDFGLPLLGVKQIAVGGCMMRQKSAENELGHAHYESQGCICIRDGRYVFAAENKWDDTILHEQAHVLAGVEAAHGPEWMNIATTLGVKKPGPTLGHFYTDQEPETTYENPPALFPIFSPIFSSMF